MNLDFLNDDPFAGTPQPPSEYTSVSTHAEAGQATDERKEATLLGDQLEETKMDVIAIRPMQAKVNALVNSNAYRSLHDQLPGEMTDEQRMECVRVLGFAPPDLKSPACQQQLIARKPILAKAFETDVLDAFVTGVNASSQDLCCNMMVASVNLSGLDECLQLMGHNAEGRNKIVDCAMDIQQGFNEVARQTDEFGLCMARILRELGGAATLLDYGADESAVLESLQSIGAIVTSQRQNFEASAAAVRTPVHEVLQYIKDNMQKADETFQAREERVETLRMRWETICVQMKHIADAVHAEQVELETQMRAEQVEKSVISRQIERLSSELEELKERKATLHERMNAFESRQHNIHGEETKNDADIHQEAQTWIKEEIRMQERSLDERIKVLNEQATSLVSQAAKFENESITATDGMQSVTHTTTRRTGIFGWYRSTQRESRLEKVRPNEKERLQRLAQSTAAKKADVDREIDRLMQEMRSVRVNIKNALQEQARQNRAKQLTSIQTQIAYLKGLLDGLVEKIGRVENQLMEEKAKLESAQNRLKVMEKNYHAIDQSALREIATQRRRAKKRYDDAKNALEEHMQRMDVTNGNDYVSLLTLLSGLNESISALPNAITKLETSYRAAYEAFNGQLFESLAAKVPQDRRREFLKDLIRQLQALCEISWSLMKAPVQTMALNRAIAYQKLHKSLEAPSGVIIEEAE